MVANVWKVVAAQGDHVDDGDTLVILAEGPGVLVTLHVAEGDVVQEGDLIAVIS
jgi:biotin carboxyl carrier protein